MKKVLITLALIAGISTSVFGIEWGGHFNNSSSGSTADFKSFNANQSNAISFSLSGALTKDKSLRFVTEALYKYNLAIPVVENSFVNIVDLPLLKLAGSWGGPGSYLQLNAGRFGYADKAGHIFSQASDGINVSYSSYEWIVGVYAGYTGLLNRFTVFMENTPEEQKLNQLYDFSYGFVPLMADFTFTNIGDSSLGVQAAYFLDVNGNKNDRAYANITSAGPLGSIGTYYFAATVGTAKFNNLMLRASVDLSFPVGNNIIVSAGADYASGKNNVFAPFVGITQLPLHSSLMGTGLETVIPRLSGMFVFDNVIVTLNEKLISVVTDKFGINGLDSNVSVVYNLFKDLKLSATVTAYTDFRSQDANNFSAGLNIDFAF